MQTYAVYLKPKSSFIAWPTSDTLSGAICWSIYHLYGARTLTTMLDEFKNKPKFILSAAFPYLEKNGSRIRFFPKPLIRELRNDDVENLAVKQAGKKADRESLAFKKEVVKVSGKLKEIKKVSYVSESLFKEIVEVKLDMKGIYKRQTDTGTAENDIEKLGNSLVTFGERKKIDPDKELKDILKESDVLKNQIDRVAGTTGEGLPFLNKEFFLNRIYGGLWFLIRTDDIEFFKPLFSYLQDTGIGANRTNGKGHYEITWNEKPYQLPEAQKPDSFIILSRWFPYESEKIFGNG